MNQAGVLLASCGTETHKHNLDEHCPDPPSKRLRRPRGRPPLHSPLYPPTSTSRPQKDARQKRTWSRKNTHSSPSELREQHLHRNRVAASKYRQKHKTWNETLADRCQNEANKRKYLQDLTKSLREEVLSLKEQAIYQSGCDCMIMKLYLKRQTVSLLGLSPESLMSPLVTTSLDSISPTSSSFMSPFDDEFFSGFN